MDQGTKNIVSPPKEQNYGPSAPSESTSILSEFRHPDPSVSALYRPVIQIRPTSKWLWLNWGEELWEFRDLLFSLASRDLKLRYRQTALGVLWVVFQPVAGAGIFTLVFGWVAGLAKHKDSYFLFSLSGLLVWNAFQSTLGKTSMALLGNAALVAKVYFPRLLLPLATILSTLVDFGIGLVVFVVVGAFSHWHPTATALLALPLWIGAALAVSTGLGLLAASIMTRFRDVQHVLPMLLPFLMYASPVAYSVSAVPERWRSIFQWNPVTWILEGTRAALLAGETVPWPWATYTIATSICILMSGLWCFRRMERSFADVL